MCVRCRWHIHVGYTCLSWLVGGLMLVRWIGKGAFDSQWGFATFDTDALYTESVLF